jgi:phospholipase C
VIGKPQSDPFDHTSILATLEKRFDLEPINRRDAAAPTLEAALNLDSPRLSPEDAPIILPPPATDSLLTRFANLFRRSAITAATPLSHHQKAQLALAHACDMQMLDAESQPAARRRYQSIKAQNSNVQKDAADYVHEVEARISAKRKQNIKQ